MAEKSYPHHPPRELADNLWEVRGEWSNKFGRRMTIIRLTDGRIALHSAIQLQPKEITWLKSLGTVAFVIAPNTFHCSDAGWAAKEFPQAELFAPKEKFSFFQKQSLSPKDVNAEFPVLEDLKCIPMRGTRMREAAFVHIPSSTLILCDLAFHMPDVFTGLEKIIMKWNKVGGGRFGPSRLTKLVFASNRAALVQSYNELLAQNFDRVIVNHGEVLESGGREKLKAGIEEIFGAP